MFKFVVVLICVAASAFGSPFEPIAIRKLRLNPLFPNGRIVGGEEIDITAVPYQVALEFNGRQFCGGSLVSETHVITAAHCLVAPLSGFWIRVGSSKRAREGTELKVKNSIAHPLYSKKALDYDAGVIELLQKATFSDKVKPIPVSEVEAPVNSKFRVSGWGTTTEGGNQPVQLLSVDIPVIDRDKCQEMYKGINTITKRMICAYEFGRDSCQGDSGGPAAVDGKLYGIVSWGVGCARPNFAGVYTNIGDKDIREFIRKHAKV